MSTDLKSQIHTYGAQLADSQTPITDADIAELLGKVRHLPPTPASVHPKSRLWVAVAAGVAVLVLFGGLTLLLSRNGLDVPPATTPPTVTSVTNPATTTSLPTEGSGSVTGVNTDQSLSNESSIGWEWHETGLGRLDRIYRLGNGTYVAYGQGWNGTRDAEDGTPIYIVDLPGQSGQGTNQFDDPIERFHFSTDGKSWDEVPLNRFEGFATYAHLEIPGGAPYLYVSVRLLDASVFDEASWSTWATDDGKTWFEVLVDGESAGTYWLDVQRIGDTIVAQGDLGAGSLVSSDGGRSFTTIESDMPLPIGGGSHHYEHEGKFRYLAWGDVRIDHDGNNNWFAENPVLWESSDGVSWTKVGVVTGLSPSPDGRALSPDSGLWIEPLADGSLLLVGTDRREATFNSGDGSLYILKSKDGGLSWQQSENVPTSADPDHDSLIAPPQTVTAIDGWVTITIGDVTLATDGNTWIRVDMPPGLQGSLDRYGNRLTPLAMTGALTSGWDMEWITLPSR